MLETVVTVVRDSSNTHAAQKLELQFRAYTIKVRVFILSAFIFLYKCHLFITGLSNKPLTSHAVPRERGLVITNLNDTSLGLETETGSEAGRWAYYPVHAHHRQ